MIAAIIWFGLIVGIYLALYIANSHTPKPEGCEDLSPACHGCHNVACSHYHKEASE